jgi:hypothetical protein
MPAIFELRLEKTYRTLKKFGKESVLELEQQANTGRTRTFVKVEMT